MSEMAAVDPLDDDARRAEIIRALGDLRKSFVQLSKTISVDNRVAATVETGIRAGMRVTDVMSEVPMSSVRTELTHQIAELEHARGRARMLLADEMHREGMSIVQIARTFGISRQLAS